MDRAGAALGHAAAELRPGEPEQVADHPQERHLRGRIDLSNRAVDVELHVVTLLRPPTFRLTGQSVKHAMAVRSGGAGAARRLTRTDMLMAITRGHLGAMPRCRASAARWRDRGGTPACRCG